MSQIKTTFIRGGDASDVFTAGVTYDAATDTYSIVTFIEGVGGADTLTAISVPVIINGNDQEVMGTGLFGGDGNDILNGRNGNDDLRGEAGDDVLNGGDGDDYLDGGTGSNALVAGAGNDTLVGSETDTVLDGGAGNDTLIAIGNMAGAPSLVGIEYLRVSDANNNGNDRLSFTAAQLNGFVTVKVMQGPHSGINLATAGTVGANFTADSGGGFIGSAGADTIDLSSTQRGWSVFAGDDLGGNVLTGGSENDGLNAGQGGDTLNGGAGDDSLWGGEGNDTLNGGAGNDGLNGGGGINTAVYSGRRSDYTITFNSGNSTYTIQDNRAGSPDGTDTLIGITFAQFSDSTYTGNLFNTIVDPVPPDTALVSTPPSNSKSSQATFTWSGSDVGSGVDHYLYKIDGGSAVSTPTTSATLTGLADGPHTFAIQAVDGVGNIDASPATYSWAIDTKPPAVGLALTNDTGTSTSDRITRDAHLGGSGDSSAVVHFKIDNVVSAATATADGTGKWTFAPSGLTDGSHTIMASETDLAGNTGSGSLTFTLDTTAPTPAITNAGGLTNKTAQTIAGTIGVADAGLVVSIFDGATLLGTVTPLANGTWSKAVTLSGQGAHSLTAKATDAAGNTGVSAAVTYTLDTVAPAVAITSSGIATNQATQTISGTIGAADAGAMVSVFDGATLLGSVAPLANGTWSKSVTLSAQGANAITAKATDAAGNTGTSAAVTYTLDSTPPALTIKSAGGQVSQSLQTVAGTIDAADSGLTVAIYDGATLLRTVAPAADGTWSTGITLAGAGAHAITAKATDAFGNQGTSAGVTYTLASQPGSGFIMASGSPIYASGVILVPDNISIVAGSGNAITSDGSLTVLNHGTLFGYLGGIFNDGLLNGDVVVSNASTGVISSYFNEAIAIQGSGSFLISNYGYISQESGIGTPYSDAVHTYQPGTLYNYGTITGMAAVVSENATPNTTTGIYNLGSLTGFSAFIGGASQTYLYNSGQITGLVDLGTGDGSTFDNLGSVHGDVTLGPGSDGWLHNSGAIKGDVHLGGNHEGVDSTLGTIDGTIWCESAAGNIAVGGQTGGRILGGAGDDMLYANATQAAADNEATTFLAAGGGQNALYGGGGYNYFDSGLASFNQIWGGASKMIGVAGYTNNTVSYAHDGGRGVYVDLLNGHNAYLSAVGSWTGVGAFEDSIQNVPNVIGSSAGDVIQCDNGTDRITGGGGSDSLYAGAGPDTFVLGAYSDSNLTTGYDTIVGFKTGIDKIDLSALHVTGANLAISTAGTSNTLYIEMTPGTFTLGTDLALVVNTTTPGGLHASDFVF